MPLTHNVPPPMSFEKSKLDWLLAINEQYFEAELQTVVSIFSIFHYSTDSLTLNFYIYPVICLFSNICRDLVFRT